MKRGPPRNWRGLLVLVSAAAFPAAFAFSGCGADVSLGGGGDADVPTFDGGLDAAKDGNVARVDCEPCAVTEACRPGSICGALDAGDAFCFAQCDASTQCDPDETCTPTNDVTQSPRLACVPNAGVCPTVVGPTGPDGGTLAQCGALVGPSVADAGCKACHYDCQKNGCYGGYYCDVTTRDCTRPPTKCL